MKAASPTLNAKRLKLIAVVIITLVQSSQLSVHSIFAQNPPTLGGVAVNIEINDTDLEPGDIISVTKGGFKRSTQEYDILMFGVVANAPILSVEPKGDNTRAVVSSGETQVRVTNQNGNIEEGDLITSSSTPGLGQKAISTGYVIGKALQSYTKAEPGLIAVLVSPSFGGNDSLNGAAGSILNIFNDPKNAKLMLAAILGVVILAGGAVAVTRLVTTGVAAVGRNPLAKATIYRSMAMTGSIIAILSLVGIGLVVAIIRLG